MALQSESGVRVVPGDGIAAGESDSAGGPEGASQDSCNAADGQPEEPPAVVEPQGDVVEEAESLQQPIFTADSAMDVSSPDAVRQGAARRDVAGNAEETPAVSSEGGPESMSVEKARDTDVDRRQPRQIGEDGGGDTKSSEHLEERLESQSLFKDDDPASQHPEDDDAQADSVTEDQDSAPHRPVVTESSFREHFAINGSEAGDHAAAPAHQAAENGGVTPTEEEGEPSKETTAEEPANTNEGHSAGANTEQEQQAKEAPSEGTARAARAEEKEEERPAAPQRPKSPVRASPSTAPVANSPESAEAAVPPFSRGWSQSFEDEEGDEMAGEEDDREILPGKTVALFGFDPETNLELAFCEGQHLEVLEVHEDGWCLARTEKGATGLVPTSYLRMSHQSPRAEDEESVDEGEFGADGCLKRRPSQQAMPPPPRCTRLGSFRSRRRSQDEEDEEASEAAAKAAAANVDSPSKMSGTGPHGPWEIVQVITPAMANKLVLNRGAMFSKFSYKRASVGVRYKEERLVWLSGDHKIQWQDPLAPSTSGGAVKTHRTNSIRLRDIKQMAKSAPEHYCVDEARCIYIVTPVRSLLLEAKDSDERDFWFHQIHEHWISEQANERHRKRQERLAQKDIDIPERRRQWMQEVLPNLEKMRGSKQCKDLCWLGVPTNLRSEVWVKCIGNQLQITKELYEIFRSHAIRGRKDLEMARKRALESGHQVEEDSQLLGSEASLKVLDKDLPRTFAQLGFFHKGGPLEQQLRDVLEAYIFYRPDVGYVQGMSYLAAMLLLTMDTFQAFVALCNLLHSHYFLSFFMMDMVRIRIRFAVFEHFFEKQLPDLFATFEELGVTTDTYLLNWLMTLFSKSLPVDITTRLWDNYLLCGESFMIRSALGVLKWLSQTHFVDLPFEELMVTLTHLHDQECIDEDELFECIAAIKVTEDEFAAILAKKTEEMETSFAKELSLGSSFHW